MSASPNAAIEHSAHDETVEAYLTLNVRLPDGRVVACLAADGFSLVELMRSAGLPIKAECGGSGVCATCHVRLPTGWAEEVAAPDDEEIDKLDEIAGADDSSRLACQIRMTPALDGLEIVLQADSLAASTREAAE